MRSFASPTPSSPQKKMAWNQHSPNASAPFSSPGSGANGGRQQPHKMTFSQGQTAKKEGEEYEKMFNLFDSKAEIQYLHSYEEDRLAASVYADAPALSKKQKKKQKKQKPGVSGYNFDELLK